MFCLAIIWCLRFLMQTIWFTFGKYFKSQRKQLVFRIVVAVTPITSNNLPQNFPDSRLNQIGSLLLVPHLVDAVEDEIVLPGLVQLVQFILMTSEGWELRPDSDTCRSSRAFSIPFILLEVSWVEDPSWLSEPLSWDLMPSISFWRLEMVSSDSF